MLSISNRTIIGIWLRKQLKLRVVVQHSRGVQQVRIHTGLIRQVEKLAPSSERRRQSTVLTCTQKKWIRRRENKDQQILKLEGFSQIEGGSETSGLLIKRSWRDIDRIWKAKLWQEDLE